MTRTSRVDTLHGYKRAIVALLSSARTSCEQDVACVDRGSVAKRDDLVHGAAVVVHLPMDGIDIGECCAQAVADELKRIPRRGIVAGKIHDHIAGCLSHVEHENVVAGAAHERVNPGAAIE